MPCHPLHRCANCVGYARDRCWDINANSNNSRYYFDTYGNMTAGKWFQIDGKGYYFYADGALARSTNIDGFEVDETGARTTK